MSSLLETTPHSVDAAIPRSTALLPRAAPPVPFRRRLAGWAGAPLRRLLMRLIQRITCGAIEVECPDGEHLHGGGAAPGPTAVVVLHRWRALRRLVLQGDLGLAESYRDGDWSTPDLAAVLEFGGRNETGWGDALEGRGTARLLARLAHRARGNSRRGSRDNIAFHYDLGNAFYAEWLDSTMLYSSAWYGSGIETLEAAQAARLDLIDALLDVPSGGSVLEIGCGWGTLATEVAERCDARVTGLTLSARQLEYARGRVEARGLGDRVDLRLEDYRDAVGTYDRIVSIEMIEAVGLDYWPAYFETLRRRLAPNGQVLIQAITIDAAYFDRYAAGADFIQRHIFPGGMLPTVAKMREHASRNGFSLETALSFGDSYAKTLAEWRRRFLAAWPKLVSQGFDDRFRRLWEYYLCYCEAGFRSGRIDVGLYVLRPVAAP